MVDRQKVGSFIGLCRERRERFVARMIEMHEPTGMSRVKINLRPISVFFVDLNGASRVILRHFAKKFLSF